MVRVLNLLDPDYPQTLKGRVNIYENRKTNAYR